jgi:hypothetical protein
MVANREGAAGAIGVIVAEPRIGVLMPLLRREGNADTRSPRFFQWDARLRRLAAPSMPETSREK